MLHTHKGGGLMRGSQQRREHREDEGFSLVELMVASFILLFALTGLLGLILTSTTMGQAAKQHAALTNSVNAYVEYMRSLPYGQVAISGTTTDAVVPATHTETRGDFSILMHVSIASATTTSGASMASVKSVTVDATATAPNVSAIHVSHTIQIRDRSVSLTGGESDSGTSTALVLRFESGTPVENSTISGTAPIQIYADAPWTDGRITSVKIYCDGVFLEAVDDSTTAEWYPATQEFATTFNWYTLQHDEDGTTQTFQDGLHTIRVAVQDEHSNSRIITRQFVIDNEKPPAPGVPTVLSATPSTADIQWAKSYDGITASYQYVFESYQNTKSTGTTDWTYWTAGPGTTFVSSSPTEYEHFVMTGLPPFSRWWARVKAGSPTPLWSDWANIAQPFVTPPSVSGTWVVTEPVNKTFLTTVNLSVSAPTFPVSGVTYYFERLDSNRVPFSSAVVSGPQTSSTWVDKPSTTSQTGKTGAAQYYYRYRVTYTATGWSGGAGDTGWIVIGPTGTSGSGMW